MHPLFDDHGKRARQLLTPENTPAWVHTLCAYALSRPPVACVFGCRRDGSFDGGDEGRIDNDEDSTLNPILNVPDDIDGTITHFACTMEKWYGSRDLYI